MLRRTVEDISTGSDSDYSNSWISWFLSSKGNEYFCEVEEDYILDRFNLTGLNTEVANYSQALDLITDNLDDEIHDELRGTLDVQARLLYGLIHARWIVTARGLAKMVYRVYLVHETLQIHPCRFHLAREIQEGRFRTLSARPLSIPTTPPRRSDRRCIRKIRQTLLRSMRRYLLSKILSPRFDRWSLFRNFLPSPFVHVLPRADSHKEWAD